MSELAEMTTPREAARGIADLGVRPEDDFGAFGEAAAEPCRGLLRRPDLLNLGVPREANHGGAGNFLYLDGELTIVVAHLKGDLLVPLHDHGVWQLLGIYRGQLRHALYERIDDGSVPGHAELEPVDERVMGPGDVIAMPPPPADIHGFRALEGTYLLAVVPGDYRSIRRYFDLERQTYFERDQKAWRRSGGAS